MLVATTLKCQSTPDALFQLIEAVVNIAQKRNADTKAVNTVQLVLEELLTNIRLYAYPDDQGLVELDILPPDQNNKNLFKLKLRDQGPMFDLLKTAIPPYLDRDLENRPIGGLGVYFVRSLAFDLAYEFLPQKGKQPPMNELTFSLKLNTEQLGA